MENMASAIRRHNSKILRPKTQETDKQCNCRKKDACPIEGACLTRSPVYKAEVYTPENDIKVYIGMTLNLASTATFRTALSKHIWELKDKSTKFEIKWSIVKRANAFKAGSKICNLCLAEKLCIYKQYISTQFRFIWTLIQVCFVDQQRVGPLISYLP